MAEATHLLGLPLKHKRKDIKDHDTFTGTPHISQSEKDKIHDRLHALDSTLDHSGVITDGQHGSRGAGLHGDSHARLHALDSSLDHSGVITDSQHGSRGSGLHADSHARLHALDDALDHSGTITDAQHGSRGEGLHADSHARLHALDSASDHSGVITNTQHGSRGPGLHADAHSVYGIISCRVGLVGGTATVYTLINNSDMLLNIADFPANARARLVVNWRNAGTATNTLYAQLYDQYGAVPVTGSEVSQSLGAGAWSITRSATPFVLPTGLKSFQVRYKLGAAGSMDISKIEIQIERV